MNSTRHSIANSTQSSVSNSTRLLVSVRNADEADAALRGGADLIDIKEPQRGPLGAAVEQWETVAARVGRIRPLSAAMGELLEWADRRLPDPPATMIWWKFGLAGMADADWRRYWSEFAKRVPGAIHATLVGYADWHRCQAPSLSDVVAFACDSHWSLLIDTHTKNGSTLWDHISVNQLTKFAHRCRAAGISLALAGSLQATTIPAAVELGCDWVAVRGAACAGTRNDAVDGQLVAQLKELIISSQVA